MYDISSSTLVDSDNADRSKPNPATDSSKPKPAAAPSKDADKDPKIDDPSKLGTTPRKDASPDANPETYSSPDAAPPNNADADSSKLKPTVTLSEAAASKLTATAFKAADNTNDEPKSSEPKPAAAPSALKGIKTPLTEKDVNVELGYVILVILMCKL
jgi:hypothetical protein